ncbi:PorP/SprF family type IX secretion system membrane protein [Aurantibacter crassamenti]|uniref:PorP/SprF family type IX secretion system membrane protein n=1 Tax=Aurantibacter crassamenti TaxID=1837375 RepID=UPI001939B697|nr:PorP/SprF family type IX secretion system membrane protein [Aurantibacter crassamenti]MBM1107461.1 PorP/SprF family type IX secretion system membrane protein [Aurantibacter crassamenti]
MLRITLPFLIFLTVFKISAQDDVRLPADLRQHNLTTYNASLFNPTLSLDKNDPESVAVWTRWQWQSIDSDPTTLYVNYTRKLNEKSSVGAAFFQHNTGIFFNTGGVLNYARQIQFSESVRLAYGFNLFGFSQELADTRFQNNTQLPIPVAGTTNDFILQWAPGASISVERLTLSMASENLLDYNFRAKESNTPAADKIFMGMMSYDFPLSIGNQKALLRPSLYLRTIPQQENQIGVLSLLRTAKYWAQVGYNNFYGIGIGGGGTFLKKINLGAVFEFGTSASINSKDPSFEIIASYFLGSPEERDVTEVYGEDIEEDVVLGDALEEAEIKEELKKAEELANDEKESDIEEEDSIVEEKNTYEVETSENDEVVEIDNKKEQRKAEKEAAAEAKRLKKEQEQLAKEEKNILEEAAKEKARLAKEEQAAIERELKETKAREEAEAKEISLAERQREELRKAEEQATAIKEKAASEKAELERLANEKAAAEKMVAQKRLDSIAEAKKAETDARAKELQRVQDSIEQAKPVIAEVAPEEVKPEAGEKYEEVETEGGLEPGFYLIANVFGTKKYFDAFMADLTKKGLAPKSFLRDLNNYNYVYLARFNTMSEARKARDSNFDGRYAEKTWVFRVVGQ